MGGVGGTGEEIEYAAVPDDSVKSKLLNKYGIEEIDFLCSHFEKKIFLF